jgi:hypothetical protein
MKKIRNGYFINLRYFSIIFVIAFGLITIIGCSSSDDAVPPDVVDNSPFWGDFAISMTIDSCGIEIDTITIGGDLNRKDEDNYIYVPKDQLSGTYTKGGDRTVTIVRNGLTITYTEDGLDFVLEIDLVYSNDYNNFTINGESIEDDLDSCDGTVTGNGIRVGTVGVTIGYNYLQYRSPGGVYRGWIELFKDGIPVEQADIDKIELKDSISDPVTLVPVNPVVNYSPSTYYYGMWNPATASVDFSGPASQAGFWTAFGAALPADDYTWEVTTSDDKLVSVTTNYPGQKVLPVVDIATMQSVWQPDGSLELSWTNPPNIAPGDYDQLRVYIVDDNSEILYARLPSNVETMTIPSEWVEIFDKFYEPITNPVWQVQTRSHTAEGMNYARGYPGWLLIPAPPVPFGIRDQGRIFWTAGTISLGTDSWSQSITTGIPGELQGIQIQITNANRPIPPTIDCDFLVFDGGNPPTGSALFSQQLTITGLDSEGLYTWDVSSAKLFFDVGDVFTFALSVQQSGVDIAADYQDDGNGYAGGELFKNGTALPLETSDMAFITYVNPVPVPATMP